MKNVIGIVRPCIETNSFVEVLFESNDSDNYYVQNLNCNKIEFLELKKESIEYIKLNYANTDIIGEELILAYLREDNSYKIGTITELLKYLIELLDDIDLPPIAKIEICNELKLWGLSKKYLSECVIYFKNKGINLFNPKQLTPRFNDTDLFLGEDDDYSLMKFIPKEIENYNLIINNNISWEGTFAFRDNGKTVCFGDVDMPPEILFDKAIEMGYSELSMTLSKFGSPYRSFYLEKEINFNDSPQKIEDVTCKEYVNNIKKIASKIKKVNNEKI